MPVYSYMNRSNLNQDGFSLVEALIALFVLSIGILALTAMQTVAIKGNAGANRISESTNWAADQAEQIFVMDYDDANLQDTNSNGLAGLDNDEAPDGGPVSSGIFSNYSVVWNVAVDEPMPETKTIHVIVTRNDQDSSKRVTFEYIKMKYM